MQQQNFRMVAKTFEGLEDVLRDELIELGAENVEMGTRMVSFEGDLALLYKANLCCRTALRILKPIVMFNADSTDELYDYLRELDWEQFMDNDTTFSIDSTVSGEDFTHSKFVTYRVKDAIVDHFRDKDGSRPSIRLDGADLMCNVHIAGKLSVYLYSITKRGKKKIHPAVAVAVVKDCVYQDCKPVCNDELFKEAPNHAVKPRCHPVIIKGMSFEKLGRKRIIPVNGTLHNMWEKGEKKCKLKGVFLPFRDLPIDVDAVADSHKCIEGNSKGENQV